MTQPDYEEIMLNVRRSFRIVAAYQQRIFHTLNLIEAMFPELSFDHWYPRWNARPPQSTTNPSSKWVWDFLPLMATQSWFTPIGKDFDDKLEAGDWFMLVNVETDEGYSDQGETTPSFNGPDPEKMDPPENTDSSIWVSIYRIGQHPESGLTARNVVERDDHDDPDILVWNNIQSTGAETISTGGSIATLLQDGAMEAMLLELREKLSESDIKLLGLPSEN